MMATLSIRLPNLLRDKTLETAKKQGVSMNNFIVCSVSSAVAQHEAINFFRDELKGLDRELLQSTFEQVMSKARKGKEPDFKTIDKLLKQEDK